MSEEGLGHHPAHGACLEHGRDPWVPDDPTVKQVLRRFRHPRSERWQEQVRRTGGCRRPVRLRGRTWAADGTEVYSTATEPDAVLMVRCGNRREAICPSCAHEYRGDMYHLIHAGLAGGKGVSEDVRRRPQVFVTLTAPSFGKVHSRDPDGGRRCACGAFHAADDPDLGAPLDPEGHDYEGQVIWNHHSPELWRRVQIALPRVLARQAGVSEIRWRKDFILSFAKVGEFQARGAMHFHAIIRVDPRRPDLAPDCVSAPVLCAAIRQAVAEVAVKAPDANGELAELRFGEQVHTRVLLAGADADQPSEVSPERVAAYVAKYSAKGSHEAITARDASVETLREVGVPEHLVQLVLAARRLGRRGGHWAKIGRWSHMLGFGGHFVTKSRRYSTTLGALRKARADYRARQADEDQTVPVLAEWEYAGSGYATVGDAFIAAGIEARLREMREAIAIERCRDPSQFEDPW